MQTPKGRNDEHEFGYSQVGDQIYLGSDLCRGGVCLLHASEFKKLGVSFEINLSHENNEVPPDNIEIGYMWLPVVDGYAPSLSQLAIGTAAIHEAVRSGRKVYVHCKNGHGRSPTLLAAYFIRYEGHDVESAMRFIEEKRPEIHIEDEQVSALREFEKSIRQEALGIRD